MLAAVRLRGEVNVDKKIKDTLSLLNLHKINHCVLVPNTPSYKGMLQVVKDYVAFGEVEPEMLAKLLQKRARLPGNRSLSDDVLKGNSEFGSVEELSKAIIEGKASIEDLNLKPVLRLHPPRGGLKNIKWHFSKGELGYQGEEINNLLNKMR